LNKTITQLASLALATSILLAACGPTQAPQATSQPVETAVPTDLPATDLPATEPSATVAPAATDAPTPAATETSPTATSAPEPPASAAMVFEIVPAESEARFKIDETLQMAPKTVTGVTDQVAGQITIDPANLAATQVSEIRINARTLTTDNNFRNRAVQGRILKTDQFEFVTFTPTEIVGLPESAAVGAPVSFQIKGDLTVTDVTLPVVFDVTVTPESETRITGEATTTILHKDFKLAIPDAPLVQEVKDEVILELSFVAAAS
jgi:polyisoprenoid-binding protein YceI